MRTICFISCGKKKLIYPAKAKDLYQSTLFLKSWWWAQTYADQTYILSAKHGVLHPDQIIPPYDEFLGDRSGPELREWADLTSQVLSSLVKPADNVIFLAPTFYVKALVPFLPATVAVSCPLVGLGIPRRIKWLAAKTPPGPYRRYPRTASQ